MHRLTFIGDRPGASALFSSTDFGPKLEKPFSRCMDALGQRWKITDDNGTLYLIKGRIWVSGNVLFREGKSGIAAGSALFELCSTLYQVDHLTCLGSLCCAVVIALSTAKHHSCISCFTTAFAVSLFSVCFEKVTNSSCQVGACTLLFYVFCFNVSVLSLCVTAYVCMRGRESASML